MVAGFSVFEVAIVAGLPSPLYAGHTIVAHLYDYAFIRFEMGYARRWRCGDLPVDVRPGPDLDAPLLVQERILRSGEGLGAISWLLLPNPSPAAVPHAVRAETEIQWPSPAYWVPDPAGHLRRAADHLCHLHGLQAPGGAAPVPAPFFVPCPRWTTSRTSSSCTSALAVPLSRYLFNSVFVTLTTRPAQVLFCSMAPTPCPRPGAARDEHHLRVGDRGLMFAPQVTRIPYLVVQKLGMIDTYFALIFPALAYSPGPVHDEAVHGQLGGHLPDRGADRRRQRVDDLLAW